jgi:hypothetical protein
MPEIVAEQDRLAGAIGMFANVAGGFLVQQAEIGCVGGDRRQHRKGLVVQVHPVRMEVSVGATAPDHERAGKQSDLALHVEIRRRVRRDAEALEGRFERHKCFLVVRRNPFDVALPPFALGGDADQPARQPRRIGEFGYDGRIDGDRLGIRNKHFGIQKLLHLQALKRRSARGTIW